LVYAHETARLSKVIAVAREDNYSSRMVIGAIGMTETGHFMRDGVPLLVYQSTWVAKSAQP
jgi:RimJ/RimL family protein N-acetyltransferase